MGRRKIEIQPIVHERNRSVTFLKRKNGLFKKAYELGVLCSVDVAVIIFEERPGHPMKLYQYCSSNINEIVQRHRSHDGEKDTKGPNDFVAGSGSKMDDIGEGEDDEVDDDDDIPPRTKRRSDGKLKPPSDMNMGGNDDYMPHHRSMSIPQPPMPMHGGSSSGLPISSDRLSGLRSSQSGGPNHPSSQHKRPRMGSGGGPGLAPPHSRSSSDDNIAGNSGQYYSGQSQYGGSRGGYHPNQPHHGSHHHGGGGGGNPGGAPYSSFYPVNQQTPPPPSFIPLNNSEFANSRGGAPSNRGGAMGAGFGRSGSNFESGNPMYESQSSMLRSTGGGGGGGQGGGGNNDLFAFLDPNEDHSRQAPPGFSMEWPVHGPGSAGSNTSSNSANPPPSASSVGGENNWLDFLSSTNPNGNAREGGGPPNPSTLSWERGGPGPDRHHTASDLSEIFAHGGRNPSGLSAGGGMNSGGMTASGMAAGLPDRVSPLVNALSTAGKRVREAEEAIGINGNAGVSRGNGDLKVEMTE